ncbi:MAG TPA: cysteine hydrolase [Anaerolineae bacterium]|nr:cysteine hydrolase [Anaerolineae bacterium]
MPYPADDPYLNWRTPLPPLELKPGTTALLVIDMQYSDANMEHGTFALKRNRGLTAGLDYYADAMKRIVPTIRRLQDAARAAGIDVMFSRIQSMTQDGRDRGRVHKDLAIFCPPGSKDAAILDEIAPQDDEIVFSKTTGSVFNSSPIDHVLGSMGIRNLILCGVMTSGCVESAARDAIDHGYGVIVVADACASWTEELHRASLRVMNGVFARVQTSDQVIQAMRNQTPLAMNEIENW